MKFLCLGQGFEHGVCPLSWVFDDNQRIALVLSMQLGDNTFDNKQYKYNPTTQIKVGKSRNIY